jgi:glycosyltransferase involved in cell wall biosynthesis
VINSLADAGYPVVVTLHNFRTSCINGNLLRDGQPCERCVGKLPLPGIRHRCYRDSAALSTMAATTLAVARLRRTWQQAVTRFVVLDEGAVPQLVAGGIPSDRITVRPNFSTDPGSRLAPPSLGKEVIFAGRLSEEKGADVLLEAWRRADPNQLTLTLYGDGPLRAGLEVSAVRGVQFAGRVDAQTLTGRMLGARALVFPSICREAGPLAPIEAAAAGLPMILSSLVGMAARLEQSGAGWTVPAGDPDALAQALTSLDDGPAVDRAGLLSRALYESTHSAVAALRSLERIYEDAVLSSGDTRVN